MRNDFGTRPYKGRFPYKKRAKKSSGGKSQGFAARRDESYGDWGKRKRGKINI